MVASPDEQDEIREVCESVRESSLRMDREDAVLTQHASMYTLSVGKDISDTDVGEAASQPKL
jgi:hypothetical protein